MPSKFISPSRHYSICYTGPLDCLILFDLYYYNLFFRFYFIFFILSCYNQKGQDRGTGKRKKERLGRQLTEGEEK